METRVPIILPKVSVIMPVFNADKYISAAINSVYNQTFIDWELIVVNDGSTDDTHKYLDSIVDPRVKILHQAKSGVSCARNKAISLSRGSLITFLDADDLLPNESLSKRVKFFDENPEVTIVDGMVEIKDFSLSETLSVRVPGTYGPYFNRLIKLDPKIFFGIAIMVRREAIGNTRFHENLTHCEDLMFLLKAADQNEWIYGSIDDVVYIYRSGNVASAMSNLDGLESGYFRMLGMVRELCQPNHDDFIFLYKRIRRILFRTWLSRGRPVRAINSWRKLSYIWRNNSICS